MLLAFATCGFTAPGGRVPQANAVVRPLMMAPADLPDALNLYAATSFAGLMTTAGKHLLVLIALFMCVHCASIQTLSD